MADRAGVWLRVSTGRQDEANQEPDCLAYCIEHKYEIGPTYSVHGKSAYKKNAQGEDELKDDWQRVVNDVKAGRIQVVVIWKVDRLDRQNIMHAIPMVNLVLDTGGRVEFATQSIDLTTTAGRIAFAMYCEQAYEESRTKSDRIRIKLSAVRANDALWGRAPYGYQTYESGGYKYLERDEATSARLLDMVSWYLDDNLSLIAIARKLDDLGVPPSRKSTLNGWSPKIVNDILRSKASLIGRKYDAAGKLVMKYPPLIDRGLWDRLQRKLDANARRRGNQTAPKGMLDGIAHCAKCKGKLHYRHLKGKDKTPYVWRGLRCDGTPKRPSTCKVMVSADRLEQYVFDWIMLNPAIGDLEVIETVYVPEHGHDEQIEDIDLAIDSYPKDAPDWFARVSALHAERTRLAGERVPAHTEDQGTGETIRQRWARMNTAERRDYLTRAGAKVYVAGKAGPFSMDVAEPNRLRNVAA